MNYFTRHNNRQRLLDALLNAPAGYRTTKELVECAGSRFGGRCLELRREGHIIEMSHLEGVEGAVYRYRGFEPVQVPVSFDPQERYLTTLPSGIELFDLVKA